MSNLNVRGFVTLSDVNTDKMKDKHSSGVNSKVGGRVDYRAKVDRFNFVVSGTDSSARDYESVPNIKDAVITADTHHDGAYPPRDAPALRQTSVGWIHCACGRRNRHLSGQPNCAISQLPGSSPAADAAWRLTGRPDSSDGNLAGGGSLH